MSDLQRAILWASFVVWTCAQPASAAEPVQVFGLPVGGKVPAWKICTAIGQPVKAVCWVDKPFVSKSGKLGMVSLPNADTRPSWAEHVTFTANIDRNGALERLSVETFSSSVKNEIANSISARWGLPNATTLYRQDGGEASWKNADVSISLYCLESRNTCHVSFSSAAYEAQREIENQKRRELDSKRSATP